MLTKRKQEIWDNQYLIHHGRLTENKGSYEAGFILEEILGPRPETPLLDDIASAEQLEQLERGAKQLADATRLPMGAERGRDVRHVVPIMGYRGYRPTGRDHRP